MENNKRESLLFNLKVLYVEDDNTHREQLGMFIKRRVGKLYLAASGEEGLEKFQEYKPDLIIADLKMPGMNGIEMTREIRKVDINSSVIVTTAFSDVETILQSVDAGIDKYVVKPINTNELIEAMEYVALKIFKQKSDETVINNSVLLNKMAKREIESEIKNRIAHFVKSNTGKGPRNINVFIKGHEIEIKASETLTILEKKLLLNKINGRMIDYNRRIFYLDRKNEVEKMIEEVMKTKVKLEEVTINSSKDVDKITLSFN